MYEPEPPAALAVSARLCPEQTVEAELTEAESGVRVSGVSVPEDFVFGFPQAARVLATSGTNNNDNNCVRKRGECIATVL